jgi:hypothetical protein
MAILKLGSFDNDKKPKDLKKFFKPYHTYQNLVMVDSTKFRSDNNNRFEEWATHGENGAIEELQIFLERHGFMVKKYNPGIFDYVTEASVRLFQEYMITIEGKDCERNGKVEEGSKTKALIDSWPSGKLCDWDPEMSSAMPSKEYTAWMNLLSKAKTHFSNPANLGPIMTKVNNLPDQDMGSTIKVENWNFNKDQIHLIGIRRNERKSGIHRRNDDLFILLINGNVFKFWGSTDPNQSMVARDKDDPFLVEGQHLYKFGWHKLSKNENKVYRALRPVDETVLCVRDVASGGRNESWSAGCQVIKGRSYLNNNKKGMFNDPRNYVDCSAFTALNYNELTRDENITKGSYGFLADLVLCYSKMDEDKDYYHLYYTLGNENEQWDEVKNVFGDTYVIDALNAMKADGANT